MWIFARSLCIVRRKGSPVSGHYSSFLLLRNVLFWTPKNIVDRGGGGVRFRVTFFKKKQDQFFDTFNSKLMLFKIKGFPQKKNQTENTIPGNNSIKIL